MNLSLIGMSIVTRDFLIILSSVVIVMVTVVTIVLTISNRKKRRKELKEKRALSWEFEKQSRLRKKIAKEELAQHYEALFRNKEFLNEHTQTLEDFIIQREINEYDLFKLAQLNGIQLEITGGWYNIVLDLMVELDEKGWNRKVTTIKEKFGELRFHADTKHHDIIEKYKWLSTTKCELCGRPGEIITEDGWDYTRCPEHS